MNGRPEFGGRWRWPEAGNGSSERVRWAELLSSFVSHAHVLDRQAGRRKLKDGGEGCHAHGLKPEVAAASERVSVVGGAGVQLSHTFLAMQMGPVSTHVWTSRETRQFCALLSGLLTFEASCVKAKRDLYSLYTTGKFIFVQFRPEK